MNRNQLAVIHIAKKEVGMSDDEYRDLLGSVGVESSKDLNTKTFAVVMGHFEKSGFKTKSKTRKRKINNLPEGKKALMSKLEAIILDMGLDWPYVDGMAKRSFKIEKVQWLEPPELMKLVQMMIKHQKRQQKKNQANQKG